MATLGPLWFASEMRGVAVAVVFIVGQLVACTQEQPPAPPKPEGWRPIQASDPEAKKTQATEVLARAEHFLEAGYLYHARESVIMLSSRYRDLVNADEIRQLKIRVDAAVDAAGAEGWRNTRWGMGKARIKELYPQAVLSDERAFVQVGFYSWSSHAVLTFADDKLFQIRLDSPRVTEDDVHEMLALLEEKYGPPTPTERWQRRFETLHTNIDVSIFSRKLRLVYSSRALAARQAESALTKERKLSDL